MEQENLEQVTEVSQDITINNNSNNMVIPFNITIDQAIKKYKKYLLNPLIPHAFRKKDVITTMKKIYVPAKYIDVNMQGKVNYVATDNGKEDKYGVSSIVNFDYKNLLVILSSPFNDTKYKKVLSYNSELITNFVDDNSGVEIINGDINIDEEIDNIKKDITNKSLKLIKSNIKHDSSKLNSNLTHTVITKNVDVLIPVYYLEIDFNNKKYHFIMNGNTGDNKTELTTSIVRIILISILLFIVIFLLAILVVYLF